MKVIEPKVQILDDDNLHAYQIIERIGRTCYKSEDSITEDSAVRFVGAMQKNRHFAMLEHYHLIFDIYDLPQNLTNLLFKYPNLYKYLNISIDGKSKKPYILSGSFRAFLELFEVIRNITDDRLLNRFADILQWKCFTMYSEVFSNPFITEEAIEEGHLIQYFTRAEFKQFLKGKQLEKEVANKHLTHSLLFTCDRGVSHEFVRHRPASFAQESTRYCNYSKGKFGEELTVIKPCFWEEGTKAYERWHKSCYYAEGVYFQLLQEGATPQEARDVLPNSLKTDLIITATEEEWQHIIDLRYKGTTGKPHPQMYEVMALAYPLLVEASSGRLKV